MDNISKYVGRLSRESRSILNTVAQITYFYRGGIQYHDCLHLAVPERMILSEFLDERLENEAKKPSTQNY
jgi:hypothetical protein